MRTYKYKLQNHRRNRHVASDVRILAEVYNHFVALTRRHYDIYGQCKDCARVNYHRISNYLTKLKKCRIVLTGISLILWSWQEALKRLEFGYDSFFEKLGRRRPRLRKYQNYTSQAFDES